MDVQDSLAVTIRTFFRDLFSSRLTDHMTEELMRLRQDYEARLHDKERAILDLREQLSAAQARLDRWEMIIVPLAHPVKERRDPTLQASSEPRTLTWSEVQLEHDREQARLAMEEANKVAAQQKPQ